MTGLWGQAIDAEVAYRHAEVRDSFPRSARRGPPQRRRRSVSAPARRAVAVGAVGVAGAAAGLMTASGRR